MSKYNHSMMQILNLDYWQNSSWVVFILVSINSLSRRVKIRRMEILSNSVLQAEKLLMVWSAEGKIVKLEVRDEAATVFAYATAKSIGGKDAVCKYTKPIDESI
jgi:hypothetical protein